jgi:hypothetical protein
LVYRHFCKSEIRFVKFSWCEVVDVEPVVVPGVCFGLLHLFRQFAVAKLGIATELYIVAALNDRLALAKDREMAVMAIPNSELLGCTNEHKVMAVSHKDA